MSEHVREFGHVDGPASSTDIPAGHPSAVELEAEDLSDLDTLRADLAADVKLPDVTIPVETRPGYAVRYRLDVSQQQLDAWRKLAKDRKRDGGIASERFSALILANTCTAIVRAGKVVTEDGEPITFRSREFLELTGSARAADGVGKFYGLDAHVDAAARRVLVDAGWGDEAIGEDEGPTPSGRA